MAATAASKGFFSPARQKRQKSCPGSVKEAQREQTASSVIFFWQAGHKTGSTPSAPQQTQVRCGKKVCPKASRSRKSNLSGNRKNPPFRAQSLFNIPLIAHPPALFPPILRHRSLEWANACPASLTRIEKQEYKGQKREV